MIHFLAAHGAHLKWARQEVVFCFKWRFGILVVVIEFVFGVVDVFGYLKR